MLALYHDTWTTVSDVQSVLSLATAGTMLFEADFMNTGTASVTGGVRLLNVGDPMALTAVPLPHSVWLFGSGMVAMLAFMGKRRGAAVQPSTDYA